MIQLLNIFAFLAVLLRAATLAFEALAIGGVVYSLLIPLRLTADGNWPRIRRLILWSAAGLMLSQGAFILADTLLIQATVNLPLAELLDATYFVAGGVSVIAAAALLAGVWTARPSYWLLLPALALLGSSVATSHAAARVDGRLWAILFTALHQGATACWIGGLPYLLLSTGQITDPKDAARSGRRFSLLAQWSVAILFGAGVLLGFLYIDSWEGAYGTSYGVMVLGKSLLLGALVGLGGLNFFLVRGLQNNPEILLPRLRRLTEAEIGIGFTVVLAAASLTSQPPAMDITAGRVKPHEVVERFSPRAPRLRSPRLDELSPPSSPVDDPNALTSYVPGAVSQPSTPGDIAWSEYNHNWAGLAVLGMGLLAVASRAFKIRWARHWPLAFLGLSYFLFLRADPEAWPLGPKGFWISMTDPEVLQHRLFAVMIVAFAVFEWGVQNGRIRSHLAALVFPGVCAVGGALLLTHSHALGNVKEEYLAELTHLPIALLAVLAGWSRWIEQRIDLTWRRIPSNIWPVCFVAIGLLLLFYREA